MLKALTKETAKTRLCALGAAMLVCAIVCIVVLVRWRQESILNEHLLASLYSYPENGESAQGIDSKYVYAYRNAWLEFIIKSKVTASGSFECPGGQTFNKAVEDAHMGAWGIIYRLEKLPLEQRIKAFNLLQLSAARDLAVLSLQNPVKGSVLTTDTGSRRE